MLYYDSALPPVSWQPEIGAGVPADPSLLGTVLKPKRIATQVIDSKQLLLQSTGAQPLDEFLASRI